MTGPGSGLEALEARLGHRFRDPGLLRAALTHASAPGRRGPAESERLEFLGDRVVGLLLAELLIARHPAEPEGALAKRLAELARRDRLADAARALGLGAALQLAAEPELRDNPTVLGDAMEAVIGAVHLDGGLEAARPLVARLWAEALEAGGGPPDDPKTRLQEWSQARGLGLPAYRVVARSGPDHDPAFAVEAALPGLPPAIAQAGSKRAAERAAAAALLAQARGGA